MDKKQKTHKATDKLEKEKNRVILEKE